MVGVVNYLLIFVAMQALSANGLFLHIRHSEGEEKCFVEEIPYETLVMVSFRLENWNNPVGTNISTFPGTQNDVIGLGLKVLVKIEKGGIIVSKTFGNEGHFGFTSHTAGNHHICLSSNDTSKEGLLRVHLDITIGGQAVDYERVRQMEQLTSLQLQLRKIQDLIEQITKEQDYQRTRESRFRKTSESTNSRVLWFAGLQTILLITTGIYQIRHLRTFFIVKKLV